VELLTDIPEGEANEVLSALAEAGVTARKQDGKEGMVSLAVDQRQIGKAISILHSEGLPRERFAKMGEVFRKEGLISSPLEERARYLWALSQELSATVSQIDGVLKARVHVVLPERSSGSDAAMPSSAAVFVKYRKLYNMDEVSVQIKRLVANSVPGLTPDKVSVVLLPAAPKPTVEELRQLNHDAKVWGYSVAGDSVAGLQALLTGMLTLAIAALGTSAFLVWKLWGGAWTQKLTLRRSGVRSDTGDGT
jgi:type III secretion protein J